MAQAGDQNGTRGKLIIISGPSGVGKSTICKRLVAMLDDAHLSVSMTTRRPGPGEQNGREYYFISREEFRERIEQGAFLEYAEVFGNLYGTPRDKTEEVLDAGRTVILEIDIQGGKQVKAIYPQAVMVFILPPSTKVLTDRISSRARESSDVIAKRLGGAGSEIAAAWQYYDNMVINDDLDQAIKEVVQIIQSAPTIDSLD
ncbi:MAG: guanylate kinase [Solirubrobacterales bacterium]